MNLLKSLLGSKKFSALIAGLITVVLVRKLGFSEAEAQEIAREVVALVGTYMFGQGIADHGKEAKKADAATVTVTQ